jgi:glyoxylase-like metal-dependent hydrolase (beta-lactamase superfamily II)
MSLPMIQLFDADSSTYTYLLVDVPSGEAALIDPVDTQAERDLALIKREGLHLRYTLETHAHADHITSAGRLRELTGATAVAPAGCQIGAADLQVLDGERIPFGAEEIRVIHTPGHTAGSASYLWRDNLFTGDALLILGCGRTDFQGGDAGALYDSITKKLFTLPDDTKVWPGHDYKGFTVSTIGREKAHNPRLSGKSREQFIDLMGKLNLPKPRLIEVAVPANRRLGIPHG